MDEFVRNKPNGWDLPRDEMEDGKLPFHLLMMSADNSPLMNFPEGECRLYAEELRALGLEEDANRIASHEAKMRVLPTDPRVILRWRRRPEDAFIPHRDPVAP